MEPYKSAAKVRGFYDIPRWKEGEPKLDCHDLFMWTDGENILIGDQYLAGNLKEELFDNFDKKIAYLQGIFEDYSGSELATDNSIHFANSSGKVERCKKWIDEIARKFLSIETYGTGVLEHNILYCCPICHTVKIHPAVVSFIQNFKLSN